MVLSRKRLEYFRRGARLSSAQRCVCSDTHCLDCCECWMLWHVRTGQAPQSIACNLMVECVVSLCAVASHASRVLWRGIPSNNQIMECESGGTTSRTCDKKQQHNTGTVHSEMIERFKLKKPMKKTSHSNARSDHSPSGTTSPCGVPGAARHQRTPKIESAKRARHVTFESRVSQFRGASCPAQISSRVTMTGIR